MIVWCFCYLIQEKEQTEGETDPEENLTAGDQEAADGQGENDRLAGTEGDAEILAEDNEVMLEDDTQGENGTPTEEEEEIGDSGLEEDEMEDSTLGEEETGEMEDDGGGEWITPSNIAKVKHQFGLGIAASEKQHVTVACLTTDFAMQVSF